MHPAFCTSYFGPFFSGSQKDPCFQNKNSECRLTGRMGSNQFQKSLHTIYFLCPPQYCLPTQIWVASYVPGLIHTVWTILTIKSFGRLNKHSFFGNKSSSSNVATSTSLLPPTTKKEYNHIFNLVKK